MLQHTEIKDKTETFEGGAKRQTAVAGERGHFPLRFDLISPVALERLAEIYGEGSLKYTPHNWRKGIPMMNLYNHAKAHLNMWMKGDTSEDHLGHALWNIATMIDFEETRPDLDDRHRFKVVKDMRFKPNPSEPPPNQPVEEKGKPCPHLRASPDEKGWRCQQCGAQVWPNHSLTDQPWVTEPPVIVTTAPSVTEPPYQPPAGARS